MDKEQLEVLSHLAAIDRAKEAEKLRTANSSETEAVTAKFKRQAKIYLEEAFEAAAVYREAEKIVMNARADRRAAAKKLTAAEKALEAGLKSMPDGRVREDEAALALEEHLKQRDLFQNRRDARRALTAAENLEGPLDNKSCKLRWALQDSLKRLKAVFEDFCLTDELELDD